MSWDNNNDNGPWGRGPSGGGNFDNNDLDKLLKNLKSRFGSFSPKSPDGKVSKKLAIDRANRPSNMGGNRNLPSSTR